MKQTRARPVAAGRALELLAGQIDAATMYATFNMGIGFCVVVAKSDQQVVMSALKDAGEEPVRIGWVTARNGRFVAIPGPKLVGQGDAFQPVR